ncbi:hypothetical protein HDV03_004345 [Kappamyces sp. JEL0829]|nr:hypothetical protein HDV03_004345 [Kappamyces sp. JEL0829]
MEAKLAQLERYSTCDISDALCALSLPTRPLIGNIPNVRPFGKSHGRVAGPAYTCEFVLSTTASAKPSVHHVDTCPKGSILVIKAPDLAPNAVWGGLMTARAIQVGCKGVVVEGRVRDLDEIEDMGLGVWATGQSTMGSVGESITLASASPWPVVVSTGDIVVADRDGAVRLPADEVDAVAAYCQKRVASDQACMEDIKQGASLVETFAKHRGK